MKLLELKNSLEDAIRIPVVYGGFRISQEPPYIVLIDQGENTFFSDDLNYFNTLNVDIELYTTKKEIKLENKLKSYLRQKDITYEKKPDLIIKDGFMNTTFEIEIEAN